jgi:NADH:ubiquinone reductase (H+-translocating)
MVSADYLVVAAGAQANFFGTAGAEEHSLPLYSVNDAERLRARILDVLDEPWNAPSSSIRVR